MAKKKNNYEEKLYRNVSLFIIIAFAVLEFVERKKSKK